MMSVGDLVNRIEVARGDLEKARGQIPKGEDYDLGVSQNNSTYYDRDRAEAYAREYAEKRNPQYDSLGPDCTNFVSQVLIAGGLIDFRDAEAGLLDRWTESLKPSNWTENLNPSNWTDQWRPSNWLRRPVDQLDSTFLVADELPRYLEENGLATLTSIELGSSKEDVYSEIREHLKLGDIIGYENNEDPNDIDHLNVFLGFDENGIPQVANHAPDEIKNVRWDQVSMLIHIND